MELNLIRFNSISLFTYLKTYKTVSRMFLSYYFPAGASGVGAGALGAGASGAGLLNGQSGLL